MTLALARLLLEDVPLALLAAQNLPRTGNLESLGNSLTRLVYTSLTGHGAPMIRSFRLLTRKIFRKDEIFPDPYGEFDIPLSRQGQKKEHSALEAPLTYAILSEMKGRTILIAEDDASIRRALVDALTLDEYNTIEVEDGYRALEVLLTGEIDLLLLDLNLPKVNGFHVLSTLAKECPGIPTVILSSRGEETDRINGLKLGADDYIVKPFSIGELLARIQAVLRRSPERPKHPSETHFPEGELNPQTRSLNFRDGRTVQLTEKECDLFLYFLRHPDRIISQDELLVRLWESRSRASETRIVAVTLARLKEKLGSESVSVQHFENIRGKGYRWNSQLLS